MNNGKSHITHGVVGLAVNIEIALDTSHMHGWCIKVMIMS